MPNFPDEPKAKWLAKYREPVVSLEMDRISDRSVQPRYHGLDAYCQEDDEAPKRKKAPGAADSSRSDTSTLRSSRSEPAAPSPSEPLLKGTVLTLRNLYRFDSKLTSIVVRLQEGLGAEDTSDLLLDGMEPQIMERKEPLSLEESCPCSEERRPRKRSARRMRRR